MNYSFFELLTLLGALGFFIYGMKVMSEGIQRLAGSKMRQILGMMTSNRFSGVLTGFVVTCLVQSSSATTVMVVSFVNAGLLTLVESVGVIMGANIGTTLTAWLISIFGFKIKIASIALPIIAFGFPMMFSSNDKIRSWGDFLIGFALLFIGLDELKNAVPDIKNNPQILQFLSDYAHLGYLSTLIFIGVGTILTLIVQSSSAAMALTLIMCYNGWIPFELAAAMVLGENIGTTITANLAAVVGNVHAKRAARAHFLFNVFGVIWMFVIFYWYLDAIDWYMQSAHGISPFDPAQASSVPIALSIFHTSFNIINVFFLLGFVNTIAQLAIRMVPATDDANAEFHLHHMSTTKMPTPEISIVEAQKEIEQMGKVCYASFLKSALLLEKQKKKKFRHTMEKIAEYEVLSDNIELELSTYLIDVARREMSAQGSHKIKIMFSIINDLESLCDITFQMSKRVEKRITHKHGLNEGQIAQLKELYSIIQIAFEHMQENLEREYGKVNMEQASQHNHEIRSLYQKLRKKHVSDLEKGRCKGESGILYNDVLFAYRKLADHIHNINEALTGDYNPTA